MSRMLACKAEATLVFVFHDLKFLIANIAGRGWTVPGGRIEAMETPEHAAIREAFEETGAVIHDPIQIGCYQLKIGDPPGSTSSRVPVFISQATVLKPIPSGSESLGVRHASLTQLQEAYYRWDPLIEAVCRYALSEAKLQGWS